MGTTSNGDPFRLLADLVEGAQDAVEDVEREVGHAKREIQLVRDQIDRHEREDAAAHDGIRANAREIEENARFRRRAMALVWALGILLGAMSAGFGLALKYGLVRVPLAEGDGESGHLIAESRDGLVDA